MSNPLSELGQCPCCGATWRNGKPWSEKTMTVAEYAKAKGISVTAVNSKIRRGIIHATLGTNHRWQIPIIDGF